MEPFSCDFILSPFPFLTNFTPFFSSPSPRRTSIQSQLAGGEGIGNGGHFVDRRLSSQTRESGGTSASVQLVNIADSSSRVLKQGNGSQTLVSLV